MTESICMHALLAAALLFNAQAPQSQIEYFATDLGIRVRKIDSPRQELVEELFAKDDAGKWRLILVSPSHPELRTQAAKPQPSLLKRTGIGLYSEAPTQAFQTYTLTTVGGKTVFELVNKASGVVIRKRITFPLKGKVLNVFLQAEFEKPAQQIEYFLDSYAFFPDRKPIANGGKPDSTFSPGLRSRDDQVVGDHFFRAPVISAQKGSLAALMLPDVDVLADNRPMPTILDLDAKNGVVDATLMSYGFCDHRLSGHVTFSHDQTMTRKVPKQLVLAYDLILDANAEPFGAYREAVAYAWEKVGHREFEKVLPQVMPFEEYAKFCYPAVFSEAYGDNKLGWFETEIDGQVCGGVPSGWGFTQGWVSWQCWFNQLRSAWGLHWWGLKLKNQDWIDKSNKMLNLALAAPMDRGACPTTYLSREKQWKGCLITPREDCYYDLTNMAWKGIWMLRWLEFEDCPRREEILKQCREMAECMMRFQNEDGSFPTWLTKDFKVVPILDHSAQSALPCWYLGEWSAKELRWLELQFSELLKRRLNTISAQDTDPLWRQNDFVGKGFAASSRAATFLADQVVDQQRYYDFETFFSCSPKNCLQVEGKLDDRAMHDPHTLSPPQNTLSMQWTAEALFFAADMLVDHARRMKEIPHDKVPEDVVKQHQSELLANSDRCRAAALKALDIMALYQNVWSISYRKTAYTFGGFGVQNSDGEYLDARQAQFGCTLADFGAALGRRDYFERGIAATRASMTLINHPLHAANGIYPNPNYPPGLQPENCCHGGTDQQAGRTGFDWGEGSGLASMAWLLYSNDKTYKTNTTYSSEDWGKLIDGGYDGQKYFPKPPQPLSNPICDFSDWRMTGWTVEGNFPEVPTFSDRANFGLNEGEAFIGTCEDGRGGYDDAYAGTITSPPFMTTKHKVKLLVGGGKGEGVYVELVEEKKDSSGAVTFERLAIARGENRERMREVEWEARSFRGKTLRLRIVDQETGGWGHINVARLRCVD